MTTFIRSLGFTLLLGAFAASAIAADTAPADGKPIPYPLTYCAGCNEDLTKTDEKIVTEIYQGREIKMCAGCDKKFKKEPEKMIKKVDAAIEKEKQKKEAK